MTRNKAAIITGSTGGIGSAIAHKLAEMGYNIMLNGFAEKSDVDYLKDQITHAANVKVHYNEADLKHKEQIKQMVLEAEKNLGDVEIIVNNAGIQFVELTENFPDEKWEDIIAVNLSSAFYLTKYTLENMKKNKFGRIINIASTHGLVASPKKSAYVAAKHGLLGFTKAVALETAETGVTCNAICPGWVLTDLVKKQINNKSNEENISFEEAKLRLVSEKHPSKKFTMPEDIAAFVKFLCSKNADNVTGSHFTMDGGWTSI